MLLTDGRIKYVNREAARHFGCTPETAIGVDAFSRIHPDDLERAVREFAQVIDDGAAGGSGGTASELQIEALDGTWRTIEAVASNFVDDPEIDGILVHLRDVTEDRERETVLRRMTLVDGLTGVGNRTVLHQELDALVDVGAIVAVVFVDIDRFKLINDSLGHASGDIVLRTAAARIRTVSPGSCTVARFGGDEFVIVCPGLDESAAHGLAWRVIDRLREPLLVGGHELRLSASAGVALGDAAATPDSLLRDADAALHWAKERGCGRAELFDSELRRRAHARLQMESSLEHAVSNGELSVVFQPIHRLTSGRISASEALLRWTDGDGVTWSPSDFIPVAEESGLIVPIGDRLIDEVARRVAALHAVRKMTRVSVNLSPRQLSQPNVVAHIERALSTHDVPAASITFEVTETLAIVDFEFAASVLQGLRNLGCRIGLDDFGTGQSSLSYLRRLPVDFIKIDKSFVDAVDVDDQSCAIVEAVLGMAHALGLEIVAEGVERPTQLSILNSLGCDFGQGFLLGPPESELRPCTLKELRL